MSNPPVSVGYGAHAGAIYSRVIRICNHIAFRKVAFNYSLLAKPTTGLKQIFKASLLHRLASYSIV
jgi:hypothetical protein